jgi:putative membrane protein
VHDRAVTVTHSVFLQDVWASWSFEPLTIALLLISALLYALGSGRLQRRGHPVEARRIIAFYAGVGVLVAALLSPLHALTELLLSAHMVQHLLLILLAAPLLVYGAALLPLLLGLPPRLRRAAHRTRRLIAPGLPILLNPLVVGGLHALAMWAWHLPSLYRLGLQNALVHAVQHSTFLATALLFWALVIPTGRRSRRMYGAVILLVFATMLQSSALGALLTFATRPLYSVHVVGAEALGISPLVDQELAGLIMWVPAGAVYVLTMAVLFGAWLTYSDGRSATPVPEATGR